MYMVTFHNYDGDIPLQSDSQVSYWEAIVSALYWNEYNLRGLSEPMHQPSPQCPYHYKPFNFPFYDFNAPEEYNINTVEDLVKHVTGTADEDDSDSGSDMEVGSGDFAFPPC